MKAGEYFWAEDISSIAQCQADGDSEGIEVPTPEAIDRLNALQSRVKAAERENACLLEEMESVTQARQEEFLEEGYRQGWDAASSALQSERDELRAKADLATEYAEAIRSLGKGDATRGQREFLRRYDALASLNSRESAEVCPNCSIPLTKVLIGRFRPPENREPALACMACNYRVVLSKESAGE